MSQSTKTKTPPPLSLRLTREERARLERDALGRSLSAHIRERLFAEDAAVRKTRGKEPVKDHQALARVLGLLGKSRIANNLNQLACDANCGALAMDDVTARQIEEAYTHVQSMRTELVHALGLVEESEQ